MSAKVAARIVKLMAEGHDVRAAYDAVLGAGAYDRLAGEVYDEAYRRFRASVEAPHA